SVVPRAIIVDVNPRGRADRPSTIVGHGETASGRQQDVSPYIKVIIPTDGTLRACIQSHHRIAPGLIRQGERVQGELVCRNGIQQLRPQGLSGNVALDERASYLAISLIITEHEDLVILDRSTDRTTKLVEDQRRFLVEPLKTRI